MNDFNLVKNQWHGQAKKTECGSLPLSVSPKLKHVRSARAGKTVLISL
jgi:hypothetical protein